MLREESIRPAIMVVSMSAPLASLALPQDATQAHSYPTIQGGKDPRPAVLEIFKPAPRGLIDIRHYGAQALPLAASGFAPQGVLELFQTLLPRLFPALFKVISKKVKASRLRNIHDAGLLRM